MKPLGWHFRAFNVFLFQIIILVSIAPAFADTFGNPAGSGTPFSISSSSSFASVTHVACAYLSQHHGEISRIVLLQPNDQQIVLGLATDDSGKPGTSLGGSVVSNGVFTFSTPIQVLRNTKYWFFVGPVLGGTQKTIYTSGISSNTKYYFSLSDYPNSPAYENTTGINIYADLTIYTTTATPTRTRTPTLTCTPTVTVTPTPGIFPVRILPNYGISGQSRTLDVVGKYFLSVPTLKLTHPGRPDVLASNVVIHSNYLLTGTFDLTGIVAGVYDLFVDRGGNQGTLARSFFVLKPNQPVFNWQVSDLGLTDTPAVTGTECGLEVNNADNNSLQEVYAVNRNTKANQFTWLGASWARTVFPAGVGTENYSDLTVADLNHDGYQELYTAAQNNHVYQFSGVTWTKTDVGNGSTAGTEKMVALTVGDGDNDGDLELYAASTDHHVYQFHSTGATWLKTDLGAPGSTALTALALGDGNGDGVFEVYSADAGHNIYQFKLNGTSWDSTLIETGPGVYHGLLVVDADHDNLPEVYGTNDDHNLYQIKRGSSAWSTTLIGTGNGPLYKLVYSDAENLGTDKIYTACTDGHVYQFWASGGSWHRGDLGSAQTPLYSLAVGDGDNDNQFELFALGENSHIYLYKAVSWVPTPTPIPNFGGKIISKEYTYCAPNPVRGSIANLVIYTQQPASVTVKLFNTNSNEVLSFGRDYSDIGKHTEKVNLANIANGVYFIWVKAKAPDGSEEKIVVKMALVK